ncbi:MAG: hypothetical protein RIR00_2387 [Pseudomonadota bacterium]|jgi:outer membrane receptor protein involved in Fe transport
MKPLASTLACALLASGPLLAAETVIETRPVDIIGTLPLPGLGQARDQVPAAVNHLDAEQLADPGRLSLPDSLNRHLGSVYLNEVQNNPFQPDLNYRGFTASPLLGTPQGLSVFLDGVRLNQPFGDVVSWDLIPRNALAGMTLMPGSNPLFGLNTLGGALALETKDGFRHPGSAVQAIYGQYGRRALELEHGGHNENGLNWFFAGQAFAEEGWRDASPTRLGQAFGKLGWRDSRSELALSLSLARSGLTGNGLQSAEFLQSSYSSVYTKPDETHNRSFLLNLTGKHSLNDAWQLAGNAYYRRINTRTFNGDINEDSLDQSVYQPSAAERAALAAAGYAGFPVAGANAGNTPFPYWRCLANVLLQDEPAEKCNGLINRSSTRQDNYGLGGQLTHFGQLLGGDNQFTVGAAWDASRIRFSQSSQYGYLNPDRSITPVDAYADGSLLDDNGNPIDNRVELHGRSRTWSAYASDTLSLRDFWHLTLAGRYNHTRIRNQDQLNPGGGAGSLDGDHRFARFNPAIGLSLTPSRELSVYAGYNEGSRTPTATELGCADPANPCKLPNAMAGDPPLKQVVTRTWETGLRGKIGGEGRWHAGLFRAENKDDILFVADNISGYGYFRNFGKTRRQGVELSLDLPFKAFDLELSYTYLDATYQSEETVNGAANSSSDAASPGLDGNILIRPGNRMPLLPRHLFKAHLDWQASGALRLGIGMQAASDILARGNENAQHQADGTYFLGAGKAPGYAVFDFSGQYKASPQLSFFTQVNNLFDRKYATAAQLGATGFSSSGGFVARPLPAVGADFPLRHTTFYAPGAPRSIWVGVRYEFGR